MTGSNNSYSIPEQVAAALPPRVRDDILKAAQNCKMIEEVRLHSGRRATLSADGHNVLTPAVLTRSEADEVLMRLCENSVYAYRDTMAQGYITLRDGVRVGICGRASVSGGKIAGVYDISTLAVRIPHPIPDVGEEICRLIDEMKYTRGVLIYSPPGVGKTTVLRAVARRLASGGNARRVAVVDTRGELGYSLDGSSLCIDLLSGYPKEIGIAIAAGSLGAEIIVCDEIGSRAEAEAIRSAHNCGVPLIATAHAASVRELLGRSGIGLLHRSGSFGAYVGLKRKPRCPDERSLFSDFEYDICKWEDADESCLIGNGAV